MKVKGTEEEGEGDGEGYHNAKTRKRHRGKRTMREARRRMGGGSGSVLTIKNDWYKMKRYFHQIDENGTLQVKINYRCVTG